MGFKSPSTKYVLIVHTPRSGARHLMYSLSDGMKIKWWDNPFSPRDNQVGYEQIKDNQVWLEKPDTPCVVKTNIIEHLEKHGKVHYMTTKNIMKIKDWFDDILILDRREKTEQCISIEHGLRYGMKVRYNTDPHLRNVSKRWINYVNEATSTIELLAGKLSLPIHYYEDIFQEDKTYRKLNFGQKGLPYNEEWLSGKNRYRDTLPKEEVVELEQKEVIQGHYDEHGQFITKEQYDKQK